VLLTRFASASYSRTIWLAGGLAALVWFSGADASTEKLQRHSFLPLKWVGQGHLLIPVQTAGGVSFLVYEQTAKSLTRVHLPIYDFLGAPNFSPMGTQVLANTPCSHPCRFAGGYGVSITLHSFEDNLTRELSYISNAGTVNQSPVFYGNDKALYGCSSPVESRRESAKRAVVERGICEIDLITGESRPRLWQLEGRALAVQVTGVSASGSFSLRALNYGNGESKEACLSVSSSSQYDVIYVDQHVACIMDFNGIIYSLEDFTNVENPHYVHELVERKRGIAAIRLTNLSAWSTGLAVRNGFAAWYSAKDAAAILGGRWQLVVFSIEKRQVVDVVRHEDLSAVLESLPIEWRR